jgi:hypothetical protein
MLLMGKTDGHSWEDNRNLRSYEDDTPFARGG